MERVVRSTRPTVIVDGTGFSPFPSSFLTARLPSGSQEVSLAGVDGWSDDSHPPDAPNVASWSGTFR